MTGEEERLERVLPLVKKYGCAVVAISNDETGISMDPDVRFAVAKRIVERAADHGIPREDIVVDPLVMPIGALQRRRRQVFRILGRLRDELQGQLDLRRVQRELRPAQPRGHQRRVPVAWRSRRGLTSAITNPVAEGVKHAVMASDVLMGNDQDAARWIRQFRTAPADGEAGGRRTNRRRGGAGAPASPAGIPGVTVFSADVPGVDVPGLDVPAVARPPARRRSTSPRATDDPPVTDGAATADPQIIFTPSGRRGRVAGGHHRARRGPLARRRHRLGLRRPRDLRPVRGRAGVRVVPEARHHVRRRST